MIIDLILDRKDSSARDYKARRFYYDVMGYADPDEAWDHAHRIARAMDEADEEEVKGQLKRYIDEGGYNPAIKEYIDSVDWLRDDTPQEWMYVLDMTDESVCRIEVTGLEMETEDILLLHGLDPGMCQVMFSCKDMQVVRELKRRYHDKLKEKYGEKLV